MYQYVSTSERPLFKVTVHETDIFTEQFYYESYLATLEQITFHGTQMKHFAFGRYKPIKTHENTLYHPQMGC